MVSSIAERLAKAGYITGNAARPIVEHHFGTTYREIIRNNIRATSQDEDFANQITLRFPRDASERFQAFTEKNGTWNHTVQVNPFIHPEFIQNAVVDFPNVRLNLIDAAGVVADQLKKGAERSGFGGDLDDLIDDIDEYKRLLEDGPQNEEERRRFNELSAQIGEYTAEMENSLYIRPKYQTVALNILRRSFSRMYGGELVMAGSPNIQPYHIVHVWDDGRQMHGPVEVDSVYHSFTREGYFTIVKPKLVSSLRGVSPMLDVAYMGQAATYYAYATVLPRIGEVIGGSLKFAGRAAMYAGAAKLLSKFLPIAGTLGWAVGIADFVMSAFQWMRSVRDEKLQKFLGVTAQAMDANPIVFAPLTYKGKPYTAGLEGAIGPATMTQAVSDAFSRTQRGGLTSENLQIIQERLQGTLE